MVSVPTKQLFSKSDLKKDLALQFDALQKLKAVSHDEWSKQSKMTLKVLRKHINALQSNIDKAGMHNIEKKSSPIKRVGKASLAPSKGKGGNNAKDNASKSSPIKGRGKPSFAPSKGKKELVQLTHKNDNASKGRGGKQPRYATLQELELAHPANEENNDSPVLASVSKRVSQQERQSAPVKRNANEKLAPVKGNDKENIALDVLDASLQTIDPCTSGTLQAKLRSSNGSMQIYNIVDTASQNSESVSYNTNKILGQGAFSITYSASFRGRKVTIKLAKTEKDDKAREADVKFDANMLTFLHCEQERSSKIGSLGIPKLHFIAKESATNAMMICMERLEHHLLREFDKRLKKGSNTTFKNYLKNVLLQICTVLGRLQQKFQFVHGDLKMENIMLNQNRVRLIDFGFSSRVNPMHPHKRIHDASKKTFTNHQQFDTFAKGKDVAQLVTQILGMMYKDKKFTPISNAMKDMLPQDDCHHFLKFVADQGEKAYRGYYRSAPFKLEPLNAEMKLFEPKTFARNLR